MEDGEEEEMKEEEEEEEEKSEMVVQLWSPEKFQRDYITSDPSVTCDSSGKVAGSEGHEFKSPAGVTEVKVKAAAVCTPERHYRPLERAREKHRLRCAFRCVLCNHEFSDLEWSKAGWATEEMSVICKTCEDLMRAGSKHRAKIPNPADQTSYDS